MRINKKSGEDNRYPVNDGWQYQQLNLGDGLPFQKGMYAKTDE
jgi:hypothetical protein